MKVASNFLYLTTVLNLLTTLAARSIPPPEHHTVGDMKFSDPQMKIRSLPENSTLVSYGIINERYRWRKNPVTGFVEIPYMFATAFSISDRMTIMDGMDLVSKNTCIRFLRRRDTDTSFIRIVDSPGCWSYVGRQGGVQQLSLSRKSCIYSEYVAHELVHAVGFEHMHSSYDRDFYIKVYLGNATSDSLPQFQKSSIISYGRFGTLYDFKSIMHYDRKAFSANGNDTILPHAYFKDFADVMGTVKVLSEGDETRINNMYNCSGIF